MGSNKSSIKPLPCLDKLLDKHAALFQEKVGLLKDVTVKLHVCPDSKFHKPCPVPSALREKVEKELERLQSLGVIKPVATSDWAAPIVSVVKRDHSIRAGAFWITSTFGGCWFVAEEK